MTDERPPDPAPLRVAYFAGSMKPGHDGVTRVLYRTLDALGERQIASVFYSPIIPPAPGGPGGMVQVPSVRFPLYRDYRVALPGQRSFERHLLEFRPDLLHIHTPCPLGCAAVRFGRQHGIPVAATYHTHFPSYARYYGLRPLEALGGEYLRSLYNGCQRVYVPSLPVLRELAGQGFRNLRHLPHGVDATLFHPRRRSARWKEEIGLDGRPVLLYAGRLVWEKDLRTLVEAYAALSGRPGGVGLALAGDGPVRDELARMMPGAVFLGHLAPARLAAAYASCDLLVFPSTTETFGNVILEAMASGTVPVCARAAGAAGVVTDGMTGLLARPRDGADLARKVEKLLSDPAERCAMAGRALDFARSQTWERIFDRMFADYREIVRTSSRGQRGETTKNRSDRPASTHMPARTSRTRPASSFMSG